MTMYFLKNRIDVIKDVVNVNNSSIS